MNKLAAYINFRYPNWLDFAKHMERMHHFQGWGEDLLNDTLVDLLKKDHDKLLGMMSRETKKIVNGRPTTELDKFVLKMLKMQAFSPVGPFRKNTLGQKIIQRLEKNKVKVRRNMELNGSDYIDENYDEMLPRKLDAMHAKNINRLANNGFNKPAIQLYNQHFIRGRPAKHFTEPEQEDITRIRQFLTVTQKTLLDD